METLLRRFSVYRIHDKIYSFIGLANDTELFPVDYTLEVDVLFFTAMKFHWSRDSLGFAKMVLQALELNLQLRLMRTGSPCKAARTGPADRYIPTNYDNEIEYVGKLNLESPVIPQFDLGSNPGNLKRFIVPWTSEISTPDAQKFCFTNEEAQAGDRVYWFKHTHYALIFRSVETGVVFKFLR